MRRRDLRIARGLGEANGLGKRLLRADREAIWLHINLSVIIADLSPAAKSGGAFGSTNSLEE
jgi:hypothetical protein